jgi:hypothetical protein
MQEGDFCVGDTYTRQQVADAISYPASNRDGGDYATGYFEWNGSFFVFANVGVAGRTGHDYPNRWEGKSLVWFAKGNTRLGAPQIERMISGEVTVCIFWRAKNKAPFTYAGKARAQEAVDQQPVKVIWSFDDVSGVDTSQKISVPVFRRGPPPVVGERTHIVGEGETFLYLMRLAGRTAGLFPDLPDGRLVIKIGISQSPTRRATELNVGFPPGASVKWVLDGTRSFHSGEEAFLAEGRLLERMRLNKNWIGGEFVVIDYEERSTILDSV